MKAKKADKPRIPKAWRIREDIVQAIEKLARTTNKAECEVIELAIEGMEVQLKSFRKKQKAHA